MKKIILLLIILFFLVLSDFSQANAPYVTWDGKYFFFGSPKAKPLIFPDQVVTMKMFQDYFNGPQNGASDVYWCDASFLNKLRPTGLN